MFREGDTGSLSTRGLIAAAEASSEHVLAKAIYHFSSKIAREASEDRAVLPEVTNFDAQTGAGVLATTNEHTVAVGNRKWMQVSCRVLTNELLRHARKTTLRGTTLSKVL